MISVPISSLPFVFQSKIISEKGNIVGYAALIYHYKLSIPYPTKLSIVSVINKKSDTLEQQVFPIKYQPQETFYHHLIFALKYEGIQLLFFKALFRQISVNEIAAIVTNEPASIYSRKIWFLYEFLMQEALSVEDADTKIKYIELVDEDQQYAIANGIKSARHRIVNNLPGTVDFCPLVYKTPKLEAYILANLSAKNKLHLQQIHKDILLRTSAFLLLKDSKASFSIEGETPSSSRAVKWGSAIGEAGKNSLSAIELERLQQIIIESNRFVKFGYRKQQGFVGDHDRESFQPIPEHISARWQDIEGLMNGLLHTNELLEKQQYHPVVAAATIAFGFVFIHPFVDGNGRMHRYIIHHILSKYGFTPQGIIFPVSAAILQNIVSYKKVLENYSQSILPFIEWKATKDNNVEILNNTKEFYQYFDATAQTEFLFDCINETIEQIIPNEVNYLIKYDEFKQWINNEFEMPDKLIALLVRFLEQGNGTLSKRAIEKEFANFTEKEVQEVENKYTEIFK